MSNEKNETPQNSGEENSENTPAPRPKTPLEKVRESQARMNSQRQSAGRGSGETEKSSPADSYKRRIHQRKSG